MILRIALCFVTFALYFIGANRECKMHLSQVTSHLYESMLCGSYCSMFSVIMVLLL